MHVSKDDPSGHRIHDYLPHLTFLFLQVIHPFDSGALGAILRRRLVDSRIYLTTRWLLTA